MQVQIKRRIEEGRRKGSTPQSSHMISVLLYLLVEGAVKIDVEPAGQARMICDVLKLNIDLYQRNETQFLTEAIFD